MKQSTPQTKSHDGHGCLFRAYNLTSAKIGMALLAALALGCGDIRRNPAAPADPQDIQTPASGEAGHGGPEEHMLGMRQGLPVPAFNLVDHHGKAFTQAQLQGKWTVLFFGYTHCPDLCPTTLMTLNRAYRRLQRDDPELAGRLQVLFVSVDPFRDTPAILADYVSYFNPQFIGASGPPEELNRFATLLGMNYEYADAATGNPIGDTKHQPPQNYAVDHSANFYIFDDRARLATWVSPPHTADRIVSVLERLMKGAGQPALP